ncbi:hypothetical protein [Peptoniphilus asaccharolyticus]
MTYDREKEIKEAIQASEDVLEHLYNARDLFKSAKNWGYFDMFGGGMISTFIKHNKMNRAEEELKKTRQAVQTLKAELLDVNTSIGFDIPDSFLTFADYFFDGIVADYLVQSKIHNSLSQVEDGIEQIEQIIKNLKSQL